MRARYFRDSEVPSSECVWFWFFSIQLLKKRTLNPEITILYQFHAQKVLFKVPKICNLNFWIENDTPPLELFRKFFRFCTAILLCVMCYYQSYKKCTFCIQNIPKRRLIGVSFQESRKCGKFSYKTAWMHTVALSHIRFPFVTVRQEICNGLKTYFFIQQGDFYSIYSVSATTRKRVRFSKIDKYLLLHSLTILL